LTARSTLLGELSLLFIEFTLNLANAFLLFGGVDTLLLLFLEPLTLLLSKAVNLVTHSFLGTAGVVPVIRLQLSDLVHGGLAGVTLILDVGNECCLIHLTKFVLDIGA